jgi:hypothetical protein
VEVVLKPMPGKDYGFNSNQGVFILVPMIQDIIVTGLLGDETVTITGTKLYNPGPPELKPALLIGDQSVELDKDNLFLFNLDWDEYEDYLHEGMQDEKVNNTSLRDEFTDNNYGLSSDATISAIFDNKWKITDGTKVYLLEHIDFKLKIFSLTEIKVKGEMIAENINEDKLSKSPCPIRIRVNSVESIGKSVDVDREQIWLYNKSKPSFNEKINPEEIKVDV